MSVDKCQQSINVTSIGKQDFEVWGESQTETDSLEGNCQRPAISSPDIPTQEGIRKEKSEEKKISFRYGQILHYLQYPIHHLPLVTFCSDSIYLLYLMTSKISITLVDLRAWIFYASRYWFSILHTLSPVQQNTTGYNEMINVEISKLFIQELSRVWTKKWNLRTIQKW